MIEKKKRFVEESKPLGFVFDMEQEKRLYLDEVIDLLNEQQATIEHLKKRIKSISDELYCKDRKLEELGVSIECCDKNE